MTDSFGIKPLSEVCLITGGGTPSKSKKEYYDGDILWATVRDMNVDILKDTENKITKLGLEKSSSNVIFEGNVVIATRVGLGKVCLLGADTAINQDLKGIIPKKDNVSKRYLYWWFKSISDHIISSGTGATVQGVKLTFINALPFPHYPLEEQKQIVAILDQAFAAIDKAQANIQQNIQNAQDLFQSKLNQIFSQQGEGWEEIPLSDLAVYDKTKYSKTGLTYVGLENIESNSGLYLGDFSSKEIKSSTFQFDERHVLYGRLRPYLNKVLVPDVEGHCSTEIFPILPREELLRGFLFFWLLAPITVTKINATCTGARMPRANMNEVIKFNLPLPALEIQEKIITELTDLKKKVDLIELSYEQKSKELAELKKSLLQRAFSGELTQEKQAA